MKPNRCGKNINYSGRAAAESRAVFMFQQQTSLNETLFHLIFIKKLCSKQSAAA